MAEYSFIGKSIPRPDGLAKVTGEAVYTSDIYLPGMLVGKVKRSPYPFARILSINTDKARKLPGVAAVITARDVVQFPYGAPSCRGVAQSGSAPALGAGGRRFKSCRPDHLPVRSSIGQDTGFSSRQQGFNSPTDLHIRDKT